jgi:peptidoglycan/LPS O-acetylase OafA/YrhL
MEEINKQGMIPAPTGMTAIAAFSVYFFHSNPAEKNTFLWGIFNELNIGVDIFSVLSDFLTTYRY